MSAHRCLRPESFFTGNCARNLTSWPQLLWRRKAEMMTNDIRMGWNCDSDRDKHKYNSTFQLILSSGGTMVGHLFKIMARYTCGFFPHILAIISATWYTCVFLPHILVFFPALWGFYSQVYDHFLTNTHIYAHKKSPYICITNKHVYMGSQKVVV